MGLGRVDQALCGEGNNIKKNAAPKDSRFGFGGVAGGGQNKGETQTLEPALNSFFVISPYVAVGCFPTMFFSGFLFYR